MSEIVKTRDSRRIFVETLNRLAETDSNIVVIIPDVGFNYLDSQDNKFRVLNLGVTEQSATIIAAAMALSGMSVYLYSMINFVLFRPAEMVRNGIVCHKAPVTLIGVKGSTSYKFLGFSHNLLHEKEDTNFCDNIGLRWKTPMTDEVEQTILDAYKNKEPLYVRL
jgi:transketolase C-terminal domain/subunit